MITGDTYRPLILTGKSQSLGHCIGKLIVNDNVDSKNKYIQVICTNNLSMFSEGYCGYIFEDLIIPEDMINYLTISSVPYLTGVSNTNTLVKNDVLEIISVKHIAKVLLRANSGDNALVVTSNCNCNCIMCPEPLSVRQSSSPPISNILEFIDLIENDIKYLCITGGEPTLLRDNLFPILDECKNKFKNTSFTFLTNARMFSYKRYAYDFNVHRPSRILIGVPLYGHTAQIHDLITDTSGSFIQTVNGIKNLLDLDLKVEIRIVVNKINFKYLYSISNYIIENFPNIFRVNIMALEMLGNAIVNKGVVWVHYDQIKTDVKMAALNLINNGIETYVYNFPLCLTDEKLWTICIKSISDYKVRYFDECEKCSVKEKCGGFFSSTINTKGLQVHPVY